MIFDTFPFGKYKGIQLIEIPTTYITYALEEFELPKDLDEQLKVILCLRLGLTSDVKNLNVKKVYREMVKKYHPDKGGDQTSFSAISDFYNALLSHE